MFKELRENLLKKLVCDVLKARWVVSEGEHDSGELGLRIAGVTLWYYKWPDPTIDTTRPFHVMSKREFGEVIHSRKESR